MLPGTIEKLAERGVDYTTEVGGQYASQRQSFRELLTVFAVAAALVFIILVVQFGRFIPALLILAAAPLSLAGAFALLLLTDTDLNVAAAMGLGSVAAARARVRDDRGHD
jgi:multidrug efflux pump subunit AcrB